MGLRTGRLLVIALLVCPLLDGRADAQETANALMIGTREQLFLDDHVIERTVNITRRITVAEKHPDPLVPMDAWSGGMKVIFGTAMRDEQENRFKMWYYDSGNMAYAVSADGLRWEEPKFDIFLRNYRTPTSIVIYRPNQYSNAPAGVDTIAVSYTHLRAHET